MANRYASREARFWPKVQRSDGCWLWIGKRDAAGYGRFNDQTRLLLAHRVSYELIRGVIPDGMVIDHLCRNTSCVNPSHLEPVTPLKNLMRSPIAPSSVNARKTHCIHGHPFVGRNLIVWNGRRACRECRRIRDQKRRSIAREVATNA